MGTFRRVAAIIGIIVLVGIYVATFVVGISGRAELKNWLIACVAATVLVPTMMWVIQYLYKRLGADVEDAERKRAGREDEKNE